MLPPLSRPSSAPAPRLRQASRLRPLACRHSCSASISTKATLKLASTAAIDGVPDSATCLSSTSTTANPAHTPSSQPQPPGEDATAGPRGRRLIATIASRPRPRPASFHGVAVWPKNRNAAANDNSSDSRCATSLRTMPATATARPSTRKIDGSTTASASSDSHGACGARNASSGGCSTTAVSVAATR